MTIAAYHNHGRWVADCPKCNSAELVTPGQPAFVCEHACLHSDRLQWPSNLDQIVAVLSQRPLVNQNWRPGETLADLRIENAAHQLSSGLEVLS